MALSKIGTNMKPEVDVRFEQLQGFLIQLATGNFDHKVTPSESLDEIDALIIGINMLGEELKVSQEKHVAMFEHAGDAILIYSVDSNTFVDSNEMATVLLGFTKEDLRLLSIVDLFPKEEKTMIESKVTYLKSVLQTSFDTQIESKNGELKYVSFLSKKLPYGDEKYFQISLRDITEARKVSNRLVKKNVELKKAQKIIGELSKFPSENPNPILRFDEKFKLVYNNAASTINFLSDFKIKENRLNDRILKNLLKKVKTKGTPETFFETRNERHYSLTLVYVQEFNYINIYGSDITDFVTKVNDNEKSLISLKDEIQVQKEFYEFILNKIPADVAVFDKKHRYVFINPKGINDAETRNYMIGKDDFDYAKFKNISDDKAKARRKLFNSVVKDKKFVSWQDEDKNEKGEIEFVARTMGPLSMSKGK